MKILGSALLMTVLCANSFGAVLIFTTSLSAANENPANASPGTGTGLVTWDTTTNMMEVTIAFSDLTTGTTASHIHCCVAPPGNAMVATTVPTFTDFPLGVTSGTYDHTFLMTDASSYNPAFVTAHGGTVTQARTDLLNGLEAGTAYLNIHTTQNPGGEIRGFLVQQEAGPVPEPSTLMLAGAALGMLALRRFRR